jgi:hypothetical protein
MKGTSICKVTEYGYDANRTRRFVYGPLLLQNLAASTRTRNDTNPDYWGNQELLVLLRYILRQEGFQAAPLLKPTSTLLQFKLLMPDLLIFDSVASEPSMGRSLSRLAQNRIA